MPPLRKSFDPSVCEEFVLSAPSKVSLLVVPVNVLELVVSVNAVVAGFTTTVPIATSVVADLWLVRNLSI